jgi:SAM-dependent methyltransferase
MSTTTYSLGSEDPEIDRLEVQSQFLEGPTRLLLAQAGIKRGMRVLDLGSGLGHVSRAVGDLVGPQGEVVGIDADPRMVAAARCRTTETHIRFLEGDVVTWADDNEPFDAVVGRLILFHLADPAAAVRHHLEAVGPGGRVVVLDYDIGTARADPAEPLTARLADLVLTAFRKVGADPTIGSRLQGILLDAGAEDVGGFGIEPYLPPGHPAGPAMLAGVVRTLAPALIALGLTTEAELDLDTLGDRIADALAAAGAVMVVPALAGAWGRRP